MNPLTKCISMNTKNQPSLFNTMVKTNSSLAKHGGKTISLSLKDETNFNTDSKFNNESHHH